MRDIYEVKSAGETILFNYHVSQEFSNFHRIKNEIKEFLYDICLNPLVESRL